MVQRVALGLLVVLLGSASPAWAQPVNEVCGFEAPAPPDWKDDQLPGRAVDAFSTVSTIWPPRNKVDPKGHFLAPEDQRVLVVAPVVEAGEPVAWVALLVPKSATSEQSLGGWLNPTKAPVMTLWWFAASGDRELQSFRLRNDSELEFGVPSSELDLATRLRVEGTRLLEVCVPALYGNFCGSDDCFTEIRQTCFEYRHFVDDTGAFDANQLTKVEEESLDTTKTFHTFRDVTGDGAPEFLEVQGVWNLSKGSFGVKTFATIAYTSDTKAELVSLAQQPLWREAFATLGEAASPAKEEVLLAVHERLARLDNWGQSPFSPTDNAQLACTKQLIERQLAEYHLTAGVDAIATWAYLSELDGNVAFDEALACVHAPKLFPLPWDLGTTSLHGGFVEWDGEQRLQIAANNCEASTWLCAPTGQFVAAPLPTNASGTRSLDCLVWDDVDASVKFYFSHGASPQSTDDCACVEEVDEDEEDEEDDEETDAVEAAQTASVGLSYLTPKNEVGSDGIGSSDSRCGYGEWVYPSLGAIGWLDDTRILYAARGQFFAVSNEGYTSMLASEVPARLASAAGLSADRKSRLFLAVEAPDRESAVFRVDLQTGRIDFVMALDLNNLSAPGSWVVVSPSGDRFVVIADWEVQGAYGFTDPVGPPASE